MYDEKGLLFGTDLDLCDCLDDACPGCHFPCPKCRSSRCGQECRQGRRWQYDVVEQDGDPTEQPARQNNHLVNKN